MIDRNLLEQYILRMLSGTSYVATLVDAFTCRVLHYFHKKGDEAILNVYGKVKELSGEFNLHIRIDYV